ncbi:hypothetical protein Poli38472_013036 [Pythium oligandrum]|uniref:Enoyl reductase (ER) domain-containing protein n=1 Tax=Pythium oligandrum TaxID=41045 RepID=A0A8K1CJW2_PYTOL|nr:hypothetical protein Poli38472_013036 [Pythium oligandrum]|eukprot:TMW64414.1 hypothetical protein Poli38472_013036 [Pythium oligandrum]
MAAVEPRTVRALAAMKAGLTVEPWEYTAFPLETMDVEIAISHCGICGSDLHNITEGWGTGLGANSFPMVPGHEVVGTVTAVGSSVTDLKLGDRVGVGAIAGSCFECDECTQGRDSYCVKSVFTYNGRRLDGAPTYGGYAEYMRLDSRYAFKIPDALPSDAAAPLLCAGLTVYAPLREHVKPGMRVGVVGIGGLGHLALQFIRALGADPVAFSQSPNKEEQARELGAVDFVNFSDADAAAKARRSVDVLIVTADAKKQPYNTYISFIRSRGTFLLVGAPEDDIVFNPFTLLVSNVTVVGSLTGSIQDTKGMLALAAEKNVRAVVQKLPMKEANKGIQMVKEGRARYRVVLEN